MREAMLEASRAKASDEIPIGAVVVADGVIIGRGHTLYLDNKTSEVNPAYTALYRADITVKGNEVQKLNARERGAATLTGQTAVLDISYIENRSGERKEARYKIKLPYNLDGIVINIPALMAGASADVYMSEFVSLATESNPAEESVVIDEFSDMGI